jgi:hypothetical protein
MNNNLNKYFKKDESGYYFDKSGERKLKGVNCSYDRTRNEKAIKQAGVDPVPLCKVFSYINEFLELIREENGFFEKNIRFDTITLDNKNHIIIDNGIIIRDNNWIEPCWDEKTNSYVKYDKKYDVIKNKFSLERIGDLLWFKFTNKGHLAAVAKSCDINWNSSLSCGTLVGEVGEAFDSSFVFVFPLTQEMIRTKFEPNSRDRKYSSEKLELAVGNYLIDKGVPIIDFYSHMGYSYDK